MRVTGSGTQPGHPDYPDNATNRIFSVYLGGWPGPCPQQPGPVPSPVLTGLPRSSLVCLLLSSSLSPSSSPPPWEKPSESARCLLLTHLPACAQSAPTPALQAGVCLSLTSDFSLPSPGSTPSRAALALLLWSPQLVS